MNIARLFRRKYFIDFINLILIFQTCLLVRTNKIPDLNITNLKLNKNESVIDIIELKKFSSFEVNTTNVSNTTDFVLSDNPEFHFTDDDLTYEKYFSTELYDEAEWNKLLNTKEDEFVTASIEQFNTTERNIKILRNSQDDNQFNKSILNEAMPNFRTLINSTLPMPSNDDENPSKQLTLLHSAINKLWTGFYYPLIKMVANKKTSNQTDTMENNKNRIFNNTKIEEHQNTVLNISENPIDNRMQNITDTKILLDSEAELTTKNILNLKYSDDSFRLLLPELPTIQSLDLRSNDGETTESTTVTTPIVRQSQPSATRTMNDSLIFEIDTTVSSSMETTMFEQMQKSKNYSHDIEEKMIETLINAKNNSLNDNSAVMFLRIILQNENNTKNRMPFSSRYSGSFNSMFDKREIQKRDVPLNNEYNTVERQELASYYYNDKKIRENLLNHARALDENNLSSNIYNTDGIYDKSEFYSHPYQKIYDKNSDNPIVEILNERHKLNSNILQNFYPEINNSSLLYRGDRLGYTIFDDIQMNFTTTEISINHEKIYSKYTSPSSSRTSLRKKKRVSTGKKNSQKRVSHKQRSNSVRKIKNQTRGRKNIRSNKRKMMKSEKQRTRYRKNNSDSSTKYLRTRIKSKRRNNKQNMLKKKRKATIRRTNGRKKSEHRRKRIKQSTKS